MFVTNNSTKSRKQYSTKFLGLGLSVSEVIKNELGNYCNLILYQHHKKLILWKISQDEIFCSSFAAAMFLKVNKLSVDKNVRKPFCHYFDSFVSFSACL